MLAGGCCDDRLEPRWSPTCAYAKRFVDSIQRAQGTGRRADVSIDFVSLATGGTTTAGVLSSLPALIGRFGDDSRGGVPTLVLIDYSVNDAWDFDMTSKTRLLAALEALLRYMLRAHPSLALLLCETYAGRDTATPSPIPPAYAVAERYGVVHFRYGQVVVNWNLAWGTHCGFPGPRLGAEDGSWAAISGANESTRGAEAAKAHCAPHPSWTTHQLIADALFFTFAGVASGVCSAPPANARAAAALPAAQSPAELLSANAICERPRAEYQADPRRLSPGLPPTTPRVVSGNWSLMEDRPGKPGWITEGPTGSTLAFPLRLGAQPRVTVTYLRGYDPTFGVVEMRMTNVRPPAEAATSETSRRLLQRKLWLLHRARVRSRRTDGVRVTQTAVLSIDAHDERMQNYAMSKTWASSFSGVVGYGVPPFSEATLEITLVRDRGSPCHADEVGHCKFKVISVVAC